MKLKTNLHFHTADDPEDLISYSFFEGIDQAAKLGFEVIALTCHNRFVNLESYHTYAAKNNILIIPGIERTILGKHVLILNASKDTESIADFKDLKNYKSGHPESLIIAVHPYFPESHCLNDELEKNINLFDAVEFSWFYSKNINFNVRAEKLAKKYNLPFIATSDTHNLKFLNTSYTLIGTEAKTVPAILNAIRQKRFQNVSTPRKFWSEIVLTTLEMIKNNLKRPQKQLLKSYLPD